MWFCVFHHQSLVFPKLIIQFVAKRKGKGGGLKYFAEEGLREVNNSEVLLSIQATVNKIPIT